MELHNITIEIPTEEVKRIQTSQSMDAQTLAEATTLAINSFGFENKVYAEKISRAHRTLQQSWMRMAMATIAKFAEAYDSGNYDARNENTVRMAKNIMDAVDSDALPLI